MMGEEPRQFHNTWPGCTMGPGLVDHARWLSAWLRTLPEGCYDLEPSGRATSRLEQPDPQPDPHDADTPESKQ